MQEFEKYKVLSNHIERMACTGDTGGVNEWSKFLSELNTCFMVLESRITELENALAETFEQVYDNSHIDALVEKVLATHNPIVSERTKRSVEIPLDIIVSRLKERR